MRPVFSKNKSVSCINCGLAGHSSKYCNYPVTSYGLAAYREYDNDLWFLMVQRKDSMCYTEFVRGKYDFKNIRYIALLFDNMTVDEKNLLLTNSYETIWQMMWVNNQNMRREFNIGKAKFIKLVNGYNIKKDDAIEFVNLQKFIEKSKSIAEQEWEFPKGRRKIRESDLSCAIREFEEETGVSRNKIYIPDTTKQYEEVFVGNNRIRYRNVFFIASYIPTNITETFFNPRNRDQIKEIRDAKWMKRDEVISKLSKNIEKLELFRRIYNQVHKSINAPN